MPQKTTEQYNDNNIRIIFVAYMRKVLVNGLYRFSNTKRNQRLFSNTEVDIESLDDYVEEQYSFDLELYDKNMKLEQALAYLSETEYRILELKYINELTDKEIGQITGFSRQGITKIKNNTLRKLRRVMTNDY